MVLAFLPHEIDLLYSWWATLIGTLVLGNVILYRHFLLYVDFDGLDVCIFNLLLFLPIWGILFGGLCLIAWLLGGLWDGLRVVVFYGFYGVITVLVLMVLHDQVKRMLTQVARSHLQ